MGRFRTLSVEQTAPTATLSQDRQFGALETYALAIVRAMLRPTDLEKESSLQRDYFKRKGRDVSQLSDLQVDEMADKEVGTLYLDDEIDTLMDNEMLDTLLLKRRVRIPVAHLKKDKLKKIRDAHVNELLEDVVLLLRR